MQVKNSPFQSQAQWRHLSVAQEGCNKKVHKCFVGHDLRESRPQKVSQPRMCSALGILWMGFPEYFVHG